MAAASGPALAVRTAEQAREEAGRLKDEAMRAYHAGHLAVAIEKLQAVIEINLTDFFGHFYLGLALKESRRYALAREVLEIAAELDPRYLQVYVALGEVGLGQGDPQAARAWFQKALNRQANYAPAIDGLGRIAEAIGDEEAAIARYREAIAANRGFPLPYVHLGAVLRRQGKIDAAITLFQEAIRFRPDFAEGYSFLGVAYGEMGRRTEAIALLEKAAELQPESPAPLLALGRLLAAWDDRQRARDRFEAARSLDPTAVEPVLGLADLARRDGDHDRAIGLIDTLLADLDLDADAETQVRAVRATYRGERVRLAEIRERLAARDGDEPDAAATGMTHLDLARVLEGAGDLPGAETACMQALAALGRPPDVLFECGYLALSAEHHGAAVELLRAAVAAQPELPRAWIDLGLAYSGLGHITSAASAYRRALNLTPASLEAHLYLGNSRYRLGQMLAAEASYKDALRIAADPLLIDRLQQVLLHLDDLRLADEAKADALPDRGESP